MARAIAARKAAGKTVRKPAKKAAATEATTKKASAKKVAAKKVATKKAAAKRAAPVRKAPKAAVVVVNMIPKALSGEEHQDSEPTLTVNPANPKEMVASAFTPDPAGGPFAPVYFSTDGGATWSLNSIVPSSAADGSMTADITVSFGAGSRLYAGIIRLPIVADRTRLNVLRSQDFRSPAPMQVLVDRTGKGVDQPYVQAIARGGKDCVYVGDNDFNSPGKTATIDQSLDAAGPKPKFGSVRLESRTTPGQDGPPVRPCPHPDGTVYAVYHAWRSFNPNTGEGTADVVVVRDDHGGNGGNGGNGASPYGALVDPGDGKTGLRVAKGVKFVFGAFLGLQRTGGDVAIAVDPTDSAKVYVAYNDDRGAAGYMLHLVCSKDRGATWSSDLRTVPNALNASLAVNAAGRVGLLYQQLTGSGAAQRWASKFASSSDGTNWQDATLADTPARNPPKQFDPYLGDYAHLTSVGNDFFGIFSASNLPLKANFPNGVSYQRNANFSTGTLLDLDNATPVQPSIDPFFFKVSP